MKDLVVIENNQALTDSRIVAEKFGKRHDKVVRDIKTLIQQMASASQSPKMGNGVNTPTSPMFLETTYQPEEGGRDFSSVKKLNQLDQAEDIAGNIILSAIAKKDVLSLAEIDAQILLQLKQLNNLLGGQLFLPL